MAKDLSRYMKKYDENIASFTEFEARDFIQSLRKDGQVDKAIEVAKALKINCVNLHGYESEYAWALYYKNLTVDNAAAAEDEEKFLASANEILGMCAQEQYSPYEAVINRLIRYYLSQKNTDWAKVAELLSKLDVNLLSKEPYTTKDGKKIEPAYERYMRLTAKANYELGNYEESLKAIEVSYATIKRFHSRATLNQLRTMHVNCLVKMENYDAALKEYLQMQGQTNDDHITDTLYKIYSGLGRNQEANAFLLYDLYNKGFNAANAHLYDNVRKAAVKAEYTRLADLAASLVEALKAEKADGEDHNSGNIYDDMMDELTGHLNKLVDRKQGKVGYYKEDAKLGNINCEGERVFFLQADYIFDEEVKRYDIVEFTVLPTYDRKKDALSSKAILITFVSED